MEKQYHSFTDLEVWKKARELKVRIWELVKTFPSEEKYKLTDQLIRCSRSIGNNIAEGHGRFSYKDQLHFCMQARGSLSETYGHLIDAYDCNYVDEPKLKYFKTLIDQVAKLLNGYIAFLRTQLVNNPAKSSNKNIK